MPEPATSRGLSFDAVHFMQPDLFWERAVRFGFVAAADLAMLRATAAETGDWSLFAQQGFVGLPGPTRDWLYTARFPSLFVGSLLQGGVAARWAENRSALADGRSRRGQYAFGTEPGSAGVAVDAHLANFAPAPLLDRYFDRILALLADHGIPAVFLPMPINHATGRAVKPELRAAFASYLARYEARYPGFHVLAAPMPVWPDRYFGDAFSHLNPTGAALFTTLIAHCLTDTPAAHASCPLYPAEGTHRGGSDAAWCDQTAGGLSNSASCGSDSAISMASITKPAIARSDRR